MIAYVFKDVETGGHVDVLYPAGKAPKIGRVITRKGQRLQRVPSVAHPKVDNIRFQSWWFPRWTKGAKHYTPDGLPCFKTRAEAKDMAKRYGYQYDY